jgi:hypothetical protein
MHDLVVGDGAAAIAAVFSFDNAWVVVLSPYAAAAACADTAECVVVMVCNVFYKRVALTSELPTLLTLRTYTSVQLNYIIS